MHRNRSSSKRSSSPNVVPEDSSTLPQTDGSSLRKPAASAAVEEPRTEEAEPPELPAFLMLTDADMREKYSELNQLENERVTLSNQQCDDGSEGEWARLDPDPVLDRYNNIHPWANNRIKLHVPEGYNDYINASLVTLVSTSRKQTALKSGVQDKYICMQGPKKQTVDHVWHMVWHEVATPYNSSPAVILMLSPTHTPASNDPTKTFEKCFPYYPVDENSPPLKINENNDLGEDFKAEVRFISREPSIEGTAIEIRKLAMTVEGHDEEKPIWHYLYPNWPDFGALKEENVASVLGLMDISRKQNGQGENPRIVHCSAGVGRTGTFIALEFLIGELQGGAWEGWDQGPMAHSDPIYDTVNQLRMQRKTMVQAYEQYAFLYEVLRKIWEEKYGTECGGGDHTHQEKQTQVCGIDSP